MKNIFRDILHKTNSMHKLQNEVLVSSFLIILLIMTSIIVYFGFFASSETIENRNLSGVLYINGVKASAEIEISFVFDSGMVNAKTNETGSYYIDVSDFIGESYKIYVSYGNTNYLGVDRGGNIIDSSLIGGSLISQDIFIETGSDADDTDEDKDNSDDSSDEEDKQDEDNTDNDQDDDTENQDEDTDEQEDGDDTDNQDDDANDQYEDDDPIEDEDDIPNTNVFVTKRIWDETSQQWVTFQQRKIDDIIRFKIMISNQGESTVNNITVTDLLPEGMIYQGNITTKGAQIDQMYFIDNTTVKWEISSIPSQESAILSFNCSVHQYGNFTNRANIRYEANKTLSQFDEDHVSVFIPEELVIQKQIYEKKNEKWVDEISMEIGSRVRYNISFWYNGSTELQNVSIIDSLPDGMVFLGNITVNDADISTIDDSNNNTIQWKLSTLSDSTKKYIEFDVNITDIQTLINSVEIGGIDTNNKEWYHQDSATVVSRPPPTISIQKTVSIDNKSWSHELSAFVNDTVLFNITIENIGNSILSCIGLRDSLPGQSLEYRSNSTRTYYDNRSFRCEPVIHNEDNMLIWDDLHHQLNISLNPGEQLSVIYAVLIKEDGSLYNTAEVTSSTCSEYDYYEYVDSAVVHALPPIEPLRVDAGGPYQSVIGEKTVFHGTVHGGIKNYTWSWYFGDGNMSTQQHPSHTYKEIGVYWVIVNVTDGENNTATDKARVEITELDTIPPEVIVMTPIQAIYVNGNPIIPFFTTIIIGEVNISFYALDYETDIERIDLLINSRIVATYDGSEGYYIWDERMFRINTIKVKAFDTAGNVNFVEKTAWKFT